MIWVYGVAGLVAFVIAATIVAAIVQAVKSKGSFRVELDAPTHDDYGGQIRARFDTADEMLAFVTRWRALVADDTRAHAERIP
jgi:uncharacterized membrane-anchored protein YhcB (DUF1043 family)